MSEQATAEAATKSQNEFIDELISNLTENKFTTYIYAPAINFPSGGMSVLFKLAKTLQDGGFKVKVVYEPRLDQRASYEQSNKQKKQVDVFEKFQPKWLDFSISDLEFSPLGDKEISFSDGSKAKCQPLSLTPSDFLIIPEGFPDVMQKTMQVPCRRIVLAQSWMYILNSMQPGQKWQHLGIQDVISVSDAITEYLNSVMPGLHIKSFKQSINRDLFKPPVKMSDKYPMIGFMGGRGQESQMKIQNVIKNFYAFYPHLRWVRFVELSGLSKEEFAERLSSCAFVLYTDEIAGFGTLPLEAMACGTHVIGWTPFGSKEYINENNGFWAVNGDVFQLSELIGIAVEKWLLGEMDTDELQPVYEQTLAPYTEDQEKEQIINLINEYKNERINELRAIQTK